MLAVVLGVATVALAAVPGDPFKLGKLNTIDAISRLRGAVNGPMLLVDNDSSERRATALRLAVEDGKAPLKVNTSAGKAKNLNADKLDGKSHTDFYAAGSQVEDSKHAEQADSATNAQTAENATNAQNADKLGGDPPSAFARAYKSTVVVSPVGTDTENGDALLAALSGITDASASKPYLLYIEAGTYDLGTGTLQMKQHVDIQGAGELQTVITSSVFSSCDPYNGTVRGANNAELRFLAVENTAASGCAIAIYNQEASPHLTFVTATSVASSFSWAVLNVSSSPTIKQSSLRGSGASLIQASGGTGKVANTQLVGTVEVAGATLQCFNNYGGNLAAVTCP